ncbi:TetR/AcrR family transcriptional regulator [Cohnella thailandensis]|uniref:TetR/AcrR family transcriptional regulator C-terminal domain-containing protein n=1 Tax=Cohnella thailandensis TaxID=557557 RepID=A0A841SWJ2_9BACL|nr:TetR/AcrR family transcriptional regulator [Cohnella thailandensis]MBB6634996.1 TetR/AcrR family transcriptional regulator C-terminal domain-containing protein [Cohnella thailandensis]MBP1975781.1 AcrR family transcriptional regulator [Cohnella thailandensis]
MTVPYPDRRVRKTKEILKSSLLTLMQEKSFQQISITELVSHADCTRGTFYAHYEQKEDLLDEMIEEMFERMTEAYRRPYAGMSMVDFNELPGSSIVLFDHFTENRTFYKVMLDPRTNYNFRETLTRRMDRLFRKDFEFIVTERDAHIDTKLFGTYRIHGIIGLILEWIDSDFELPASYMGEQLVEILKFSTPQVYVKRNGAARE